MNAEREHLMVQIEKAAAELQMQGRCDQWFNEVGADAETRKASVSQECNKQRNDLLCAAVGSKRSEWAYDGASGRSDQLQR